MRKRTVVITSNPLNHEGGVVAFYTNLLKHFHADEYLLRHIPFGSRMEFFYSPLKKRILYPFYYTWDMLTLAWLLLRDRQVRIVQVNPSLIPIPLIRDGFVILLAKLMRRKVVVMFHGWKENTIYCLRKRSCVRWVFRKTYGHCDTAIVLANQFREELLEFISPRQGIEITSTMYDTSEILPSTNRVGQRIRFVFLGRISELKGIGEIIEASRLLDEYGVDYELLIIGHGDYEGVVELYQERVRKYGLQNRCHFTGRLTGEEKFRALADSDVYVFPSWTEGCPTSVLEALGAGLFVVSTNVGALKDIINEGDNGRVVRCRDAQHLAEVMEWTSEHIEEIRCRRDRIQLRAKERYEVEVICNQFRKIYKELSHD